jgi:hypothetical protein
MIGGPCHRCTHASPVPGIGGHWCEVNKAPAYGNGCSRFRCRDRCPMPDGNGTICLETGDRVPIGPCPTDCEYHLAGRGRTC